MYDNYNLTFEFFIRLGGKPYTLNYTTKAFSRKVFDIY